jgi:NADH-quinone oxidoreductase subunit C
VAEPPKGPEAPVVPDPVMEALLKDAYGSFDAEFSYAVDELSVTVSRERIEEACRLAKEDPRLRFDYLRCLAVVEYPEHFQAVYLLSSTSLEHKAVLKANAPKDDPAIPSVTGVWAGADWHEREGAELFGVTFTGHQNPRFLLLFDEFEGKYPMRKDYPYEEIEEWSPENDRPWQRAETESPDGG